MALIYEDKIIENISNEYNHNLREVNVIYHKIALQSFPPDPPRIGDFRKL